VELVETPVRAPVQVQAERTRQQAKIICVPALEVEPAETPPRDDTMKTKSAVLRAPSKAVPTAIDAIRSLGMSLRTPNWFLTSIPVVSARM
jgi:hypothetical protein